MDHNRNALSAKKRKPAWSSEEETLLIQLYRQFSLLWDKGHPDYYKKDQRECALHEIANQMGPKFTAVNVKEKMKTLRDYFVREKKKAESRGNTSTGYVSQWEHFGSLEFLCPCTASSDPEDMPDHGANGAKLVIKCEPPEVYPMFPDGEGPDNMILPSSPGDSSDGEMQLDSHAHHGIKRAADDLPPEERPDPGLPQPGPSGISAAHARPSVASGPTMIAEVQVIKCEPPEVYPVFPDGEGPDNMILPSTPGDSSDDEMQLDSHAHHGTKRAADDIPPNERPNPGLLQPGPSGISAAHARPSVASGPTMIAERMRPASASPAESPEGNGQPLVTPGPGREPGPNTGTIPPCPVHLENEEEVILYHQLMLELGKMNDYDQDLAKLRMLEALFEIKHNSGPPPSPGGQAP